MASSHAAEAEVGGAPAPAAETVAGSWADRLHHMFAEGVDGSARWVDGFFGGGKTTEYSRGAHGSFSLRSVWQEYQGVRVQARMRAYLPLDNLREDVYAFVGRGDADEIIEGTNSYGGLLDNSPDNDWLAGLGYRPNWGKTGQFSFGLGVKADWPPDPYARVGYKFKADLSDVSALRFRETVFWQDSENLGSSTRLELERRFGTNHLLRWASWGRISGATDGLRYDSRLMLYRRITPRRAVLYAAGLRGETADPVAVREYGVYAVYRQRAVRDWLFAELILGVTHYREDDWSERRFSMLCGLGFEMMFDKDTISSASTRVLDGLIHW